MLFCFWQFEEQVNGVRVSPDHVNEVRQQFMDQVNSIVKDGEKEGQSKPKSADTAISSSSTSSKDTKSTAAKTSSVSHSTKPADASKSMNDKSKQGSDATKADGAKSGSDNNSKPSSSTDNNKVSKPSQAKGRYQPDQNTSAKPGSYNGGKGTQWLNRTHSKFNSQKVY